MTESGSTLLRPLTDISSMSLNEGNLILTHKNEETVFSLPYTNIRFGRLVEISRIYITRLFSTPEIMGVTPADDVTEEDDDVTTDADDDSTDADDDSSDEGMSDEKEADQDVVVRWTGSLWEKIEGTDIKSMAYLYVLRISKSLKNNPVSRSSFVCIQLIKVNKK